jgi:multicomponent Na+:H+ antiporter subunit A
MEATAATILLLLIISPFAPTLNRLLKERAAAFFALVPLVVFIQFLLQALQGSPVQALSVPWVPGLGLAFSLRLDGLSILMGMLISGIGVLVILYGGSYLHGHPGLGKFYAFIFLFMASMLGLVVAANAILLFVFWELTSITSFFLIGFENQRLAARAAAWQALLVTGAGGLSLLAGLVLLGLAAGSFELSDWVVASSAILAHPNVVPAFLLILLGAMTKSAQFPFHFWLPNAMEAPTPVSAYLHSATMVKAGVYLLARLFPVLSVLPLWNTVLPWIGLATMLAGNLLALGQRDLKRLLAYTTVASLGALVFLLGLAQPLALKAALVFLTAHALYKGALFLAAGSVDHAIHTRDIQELGGLAHTMPLTAAAACLAGLSMAGIPPFLGFLGKETLYDAALMAGSARGWFTTLVLVANLANVAVAGWVSILPFWGAPKRKHQAHEGQFALWFSPLLLALLGAGLGILPGVVAAWIQPAVNTLLTAPYPLKLVLWAGITPVLVLSMVTLLGGGLLFALRTRYQRGMAAFWHRLSPSGPAHLYHESLKGLLNFAARLTRLLQNGYLRVYIIIFMLFTLGLSGLTFALQLGQFTDHAGKTFTELWGVPRFYDVILICIILVGAYQVTRTTSRLATIALLGSIGFSIALLFLLYSAPDLAMVQFAIETLTVLLFILVIFRLPRFSQLSSLNARVLDVLVALGGGGLMTVLSLLVSTNSAESHLSAYFAQNSVPLANGRNIVNVILIDFRSLDTLGEITVLATAAIGVFSLLHLTLKREGRRKG